MKVAVVFVYRKQLGCPIDSDVYMVGRVPVKVRILRLEQVIFILKRVLSLMLHC